MKVSTYIPPALGIASMGALPKGSSPQLKAATFVGATALAGLASFPGWTSLRAAISVAAGTAVSANLSQKVPTQGKILVSIATAGTLYVALTPNYTFSRSIQKICGFFSERIFANPSNVREVVGDRHVNRRPCSGR